MQCKGPRNRPPHFAGGFRGGKLRGRVAPILADGSVGLTRIRSSLRGCWCVWSRMRLVCFDKATGKPISVAIRGVMPEVAIPRRPSWIDQAIRYRTRRSMRAKRPVGQAMYLPYRRAAFSP